MNVEDRPRGRHVVTGVASVRWSWLLAALAVVAALNGVGLGTAGAPLGLVRWLLCLPLIGVSYWIGRRRQIQQPVVPIIAGASTPGGAAVVDSVGQAMTMLIVSTLAIGVPWLVGQALRHQTELAGQARERLEQVQATREAYTLAASASLRQQIAADLHDHVGHDLALIALQAGALETGSEGASRLAASQLRELATDATDRLRTVVGQLTETTRAPASVAEVAARALSTGLPVTIEGDSFHPLLVRAAQEALTNAARHATGRPVGISAGPTRLVVTNEIADPSGTPRPGHGLAMLTDRVEAAGGRLFAGPVGDTWQLSATLPPPR